MKIILVAGARPNFMKIAPLMAAFGERPEIEPLLVHTGQHYDRAMSDLFFQQLGISEPDVNLGVGSASHAVQTAEIMRAFEPVIVEQKPDAVLVVGDVNSTIACGLVAVKLGVKLIHVEAGLRSLKKLGILPYFLNPHPLRIMLWRPAHHRRIAEIADSIRLIVHGWWLVTDGKPSLEFGENQFKC